MVLEFRVTAHLYLAPSLHPHRGFPKRHTFHKSRASNSFSGSAEPELRQQVSTAMVLKNLAFQGPPGVLDGSPTPVWCL